MAKFTVVCVLLAVCVAYVSAVTAETTITTPGMSTPEMSTPEMSTPVPTLGPDDLTSTDYIIIGVTSAVAASVIIGGIVFCCMKTKEEDKEKEDLYNRYLHTDQLSGGKTNSGYRA